VNQYPDNVRGFVQLGQAPFNPDSPFAAKGVNVRLRRLRAPFGQWMGRFQQRFGGKAGYVAATELTPQGRNPSFRSMLPHNVTLPRVPSGWAPELHYQRREFFVEPPNLPGTVIPYTNFHPVYIPGLQGWKDTLPTNYAWRQMANQNFARWDMVGKMARTVITQKNVWKPVAQIPQGAGTGKVWRQARPYYVPDVINPSGTR
jgi:hypothetical protein